MGAEETEGLSEGDDVGDELTVGVKLGALEGCCDKLGSFEGIEDGADETEGLADGLP